ncbi:MAG: hypothetical protein LAT81_16795 [Oceanicaulis sp.]|nr:hypothetical protein [Oceanicaulis sp.]
MEVTVSGEDGRNLPTGGGRGAVEAFLKTAAVTPRREAPRGRLMFGLDATASREPAWDRASHIQAEMFSATAAIGGLAVQLVFYRGFGECKASRWFEDAAALRAAMLKVRCAPGRPQVGRILDQAARQTRQQRVNALVFVGDAFEEDIDDVAHRAGELGLLGVPAFMFHEGRDPVAERAFRDIARLTRGAYHPFDEGSASKLAALLRAVATFAAAGADGLTRLAASEGGAVAAIARSMKG